MVTSKFFSEVSGIFFTTKGTTPKERGQAKHEGG